MSGEEHYHKHDGTPYENTEVCWDYLGDAGKYARYLGLVRPDAFEDHRNPPPHIFMAPTPVQASPRVQLSDLDDWLLPWIESDLRTLISLPLPVVDRSTAIPIRRVTNPIWSKSGSRNPPWMMSCCRSARSCTSIS